jgi:hypothetical protein
MLVGHYVVGFLVGRGLSVALSQTVGGIASGAVAGAAETAAFDLLEGKPFWETVKDAAISAAISAGMGGLVPNLPGLRFRGPAPKLSWTRGWPIGGYVGPNTYRYLQQKMLSRIESKISYRLFNNTGDIHPSASSLWDSCTRDCTRETLVEKLNNNFKVY